jgi:hypothetical protein
MSGRTLDAVSISPAPHPQLGMLTGLIGTWHGRGRGRVGSRDIFEYEETARFSHSGKPLVSYVQTTKAVNDGRPLHTESGYFRATGDGDVEAVIAHGIGVAEIEIGRWQGNRLRLHSTALHTTPTAKNVTELVRELELDDESLRYQLWMSTDGGEAQCHLSAELRRES